MKKLVISLHGDFISTHYHQYQRRTVRRIR